MQILKNLWILIPNHIYLSMYFCVYLPGALKYKNHTSGFKLLIYLQLIP